MGHYFTPGKMIRAQVDGVKVIMAVASHLSMASSDQRLSDRFLCGKKLQKQVSKVRLLGAKVPVLEKRVQEY